MVKEVGGFHNCRGTKNSWESRRGGTLVNRSTKIQEGKQNEVTKWSLAFGKQSDSSGGLNAKDRTNAKKSTPLQPGKETKKSVAEREKERKPNERLICWCRALPAYPGRPGTHGGACRCCHCGPTRAPCLLRSEERGARSKERQIQ